jgi:Ala-tRNA(Pro) deacylase
MFEKLERLLSDCRADYRVVEHAAEGNSILVAQLRNTEIGQGAKAMVCKIRGADFSVMTVVPGDRRVDLGKVARHFGYTKASFLPAEETVALTGCLIGAIPPFSFQEKLRLVMDSDLAARYREIAFNAGRLDKSIILATCDYLRIAQPAVAAISKE